MPASQTQAALLLELLPAAERAVLGERRPADQFFAECCRAHREWGARDRRLFGDALFACFRWRGWLAGLSPAATLVLSGWLDGLGQQALRQLAEQAGLNLSAAAPATLEEKARALSVLLGAEKKLEQLVPGWTLPLLAAPGVTAQQQLEAFQRRPPVWLRVAPAQVSAVLGFFNQQRPRAIAHPRVAGAVAVTPPADLQGLRAATGVAALVQDLASQVAGLLCAPRPGESWWDVCAGAGGKTLHLAAQMQNRGAILATDVRDGALHELEKRVAAAGVTMVRTQRAEDAEVAQRKFDGVLVDAPCSGIGTWNRNPDMRWRSGATDVAAKAAIQGALLERAARSVRQDGALVYAVCTVTKAETTDVTESFSRTHPAFQPAEILHPLTGVKPNGTFWIWPWDGPCDGMFIACWRRAG
jgi:16S rRNA (cytosine967-C5)-methyltransferase